MLSKFKQLVDIGYSKFSAFFIWCAIVKGRVFNKMLVCIFAGVIVGIVVLPSTIKSPLVASFNARPISLVCDSVPVKSIFQKFVGINSINSVGKGRSSNCRQFGNKSSPECFSGFIELFSPVSAYGEEVACQKTDNCCECRMCKCVDKELNHFVSSVIYAIFGIIAAVIALGIYYRFFF